MMDRDRPIKILDFTEVETNTFYQKLPEIHNLNFHQIISHTDGTH